jgi:hypothetical protein
VHPPLLKEKLFPVQNWVPAYWPVPGSLVAVAVKVAGAQIATTPVLHIMTPLASYPMTYPLPAHRKPALGFTDVGNVVVPSCPFESMITGRPLFEAGVTPRMPAMKVAVCTAGCPMRVTPDSVGDPPLAM